MKKAIIYMEVACGCCGGIINRDYHNSKSVKWEFRQELFPAIENALKDYSEQWVWIVDELFKPKCEVMGYCDETKSCGRKPKREE